MQLAVWTYEGPPHVGAMRVATAMEGVHFVLHAPQGDTYADLLFTMIERRKRRPPVTYTTFKARDLGGDTAELFKRTAVEAFERFQPELLMVGSSCTAELIQDDPAGLGCTLGLPVPVVPLELSAYQRKENWGAAEAFYQITRACLAGRATIAREAVAREAVASSIAPAVDTRSGRPSCNILGPTALGFRHRDDIDEIERLINQLGVDVNVIAPLGASPRDIARLPDADFNVVLYPEIASTTARWLKRQFKQPFIDTVPIGVGATRDFIQAICALAGTSVPSDLNDPGDDCRLPWYSRSIDSTYLTAKRVYIFGDATHVVAAARVAEQELGFDVVGMGSYSREQAKEVRAAAEQRGLTALITDDHLDVEEQIASLHPELVLGTQMERHIAKRLGIPCAVISAPVHVQDFPARRSPQMGFEGANVLFDTWVHPLMMGLEEHLLAMFRDDFEFGDGAAPSHLGRHSSTEAAPTEPAADEVSSSAPAAPTPGDPQWTAEAQRELKKIPFFVRGKARRNTERFARERGVGHITLETLYDAKAHFSA